MNVMDEPVTVKPEGRELPPEDALTAAAIRVIIDDFNGDVEAFFQDAKNRRRRPAMDESDDTCVIVRSFVRKELALD